MSDYEQQAIALADIPFEVWREVDRRAEYTSHPNDSSEWAKYTDRLRQQLAMEIVRKKPEAPALPVTVEQWERVNAALQDAETVIDYAASILWNCRPEAIAKRPATVDAALRNFRAILAALNPPEVDPLERAVDDAFVLLPGEWTRETFVASVSKTLRDRGFDKPTITQADAGGVK